MHPDVMIHIQVALLILKTGRDVNELLDAATMLRESESLGLDFETVGNIQNILNGND